MRGQDAILVIGQYLVENAEHIDSRQLFELGHALGTIEQIITQQTKEVILSADNESEVI